TLVGLEREGQEVAAAGEEGLIESSSQSRSLTRGGKYLHPGCPSDAFAPTAPTDAVCGCTCLNIADTKARVDVGAPQCLTCEEGTHVAWEDVDPAQMVVSPKQKLGDAYTDGPFFCERECWEWGAEGASGALGKDVPLVEWDGGDCGCTIRRSVHCTDQAANAAYSLSGRVVAESLSARKSGVAGAFIDWFVSVDSAGSGEPYPVCYTMAAAILARLGTVGTGADDIELQTRKGQIAQEVSFKNSYDRSQLVKLADFIALRIKQFDSACRTGFD
ncbi:unnamed protein product, partial [Prorocentrum cordatum]